MKYNSNLNVKCHQWLKTLCVDMPERTTGSQGNRNSTKFFKGQMDSLGWKTESQEFEAVDWLDGGATLHAGNNEFKVLVSPYSKGCSIRSNLESVTTVSELENGDFRNKIILLHGDIASRVVEKHPGITEGKPWPQGDHSIFLHYGRPAIAVSSEWFIENIDNQNITHTPKDNIGIIDCSKLVELAAALSDLIMART